VTFLPIKECEFVVDGGRIRTCLLSQRIWRTVNSPMLSLNYARYKSVRLRTKLTMLNALQSRGTNSFLRQYNNRAVYLTLELASLAFSHEAPQCSQSEPDCNPRFARGTS